MRILVTGADGFIGKNLCNFLGDCTEHSIVKFLKGDSFELITNIIFEIDIIIHLAAINRSVNENDFINVNVNLTSDICNLLYSLKIKIPIIYVSSTQVYLNNIYGASKLEAENLFKDLNNKNSNPISIYRLPGVFGKWCKPNYNSVVATFCYNKINKIPIVLSNPNKVVKLVYVQDVVDTFISLLNKAWKGLVYHNLSNEYEISLYDLSVQLDKFETSRINLTVDNIGSGFKRALYSTYISYLNKENFSYFLNIKKDERGDFIEFLKTENSGQFSIITINPGCTRGGHYHNTKTEKFLVVKGSVQFKFINILNQETHYISSNDMNPQVVETIPGWIHSVTNKNNSESIILLWANELFDLSNPDTIYKKIC